MIAEANPQGEGDPSPEVRPSEGSPAREIEAEVEKAPPAPSHRGRGRLKTWVIVVAAIVVLGLLALVSTYTPLFAARNVRVEGAAHLTAGQVRRIAKVEPGVNVFRLDTGRAERRLERNAWVADAEITKALPSGVTIVVRERVPVAVVVGTSGSTDVLAEDGTSLGPSAGPLTLPVVTGVAGEDTPNEAERVLGAAVAASLPPAIARGGVTVVASDEEADLLLESGATVSYGGGTELAVKGQALLAVLRWAERSGVRLGEIDVRTPGAPSAALFDGTPVAPGD